jgi:hypothetical protein
MTMASAVRAKSFRRRQPRDLALDEVEIILDRGKIRPRLVDRVPINCCSSMHPSCQKTVAQS